MRISCEVWKMCKTNMRQNQCIFSLTSFVCTRMWVLLVRPAGSAYIFPSPISLLLPLFLPHSTTHHQAARFNFWHSWPYINACCHPAAGRKAIGSLGSRPSSSRRPTIDCFKQRSCRHGMPITLSSAPAISPSTVLSGRAPTVCYSSITRLSTSTPI